MDFGNRDDFRNNLMNVKGICPMCGAVLAFGAAAQLAKAHNIQADVIMCHSCNRVYEINLAAGRMTFINDVTGRFPWIVPKQTQAVESNTKACVGCGRQLRADAKFCPACGRNQDAPAPTPAPPPPPPAPPAPPVPQGVFAPETTVFVPEPTFASGEAPKRKRMSKGLIIGLSSAAAVIVAAAILIPTLSSSPQAKAAESAIEAYMEDVPFSYTEKISRQMREQDSERKEKGFEPGGEYSLSIQIPDLEALPLEELELIAPELDYNNPDNNTFADYLKEFDKAAESAALAYIDANKVTEWRDASIYVTLSENAQGDWQATVDSLKAPVYKSGATREVAEPLQAMARNLFEDSEEMQEILGIASLVIDHRSFMLNELFGAYESFAQEAQIKEITPNGDDSYDIEIAYPDPNAVFSSAKEGVLERWNEPIFNPMYYVFVGGDLPEDDLASAQLISTTAKVTLEISFSNGTTSTCTVDPASIDEMFDQINESALQIEAEINDAINERWLISPQDMPSTGILVGTSSGNKCIVNTGNDVDGYYLRFFSYDGNGNLAQHGAMAAGVFIRGGASYTFYLPSGLYVLEYGTGSNWYGTEYMFGPLGDYTRLDGVIDSEYGYYNEVSLHTSGGNIGSTDVPYSPGG
ncbi:MAG: zinc ribbon domain-containing protein [Oscillospiraceae bacterium]|jgi:uncharacterized protein YbaR (Trm112 family)|nr:zinc ribbon domain-containing protein [Oscillospiraceae bacterium]